MTERMDRRELLKRAALAAGGLAFARPAEADECSRESERKKECERLLDDCFSSLFPWFPELDFPEYAQADRVEGRAPAADRIGQEIRKRNPDVFVFGEYHTKPDFKEIFLDIVEKDPAIVVIAEEAVAHTEQKKQYDQGILNLRNFRADQEELLLGSAMGRKFLASMAERHPDPKYQDPDLWIRNLEQQRRARMLAKDRGIAYSLLQHLQAPSSELESKAFGLAGPGERVAIYTGTAHAMAIPRGEQGFQVTYLDAAKKKGKRVLGVAGIDRSMQARLFPLYIAEDVCRAVKEGSIPLALMQETLAERSTQYQSLIDRHLNNKTAPTLVVPSKGDVLVLLAGAHRNEDEKAATVLGVSAALSHPDVAPFIQRSALVRTAPGRIGLVDMAGGSLVIAEHVTAKDGQVLLTIRQIHGKETSQNFFVAQQGKDSQWIYRKK